MSGPPADVTVEAAAAVLAIMQWAARPVSGAACDACCELAEAIREAMADVEEADDAD